MDIIGFSLLRFYYWPSSLLVLIISFSKIKGDSWIIRKYELTYRIQMPKLSYKLDLRKKYQSECQFLSSSSSLILKEDFVIRPTECLQYCQPWEAQYVTMSSELQLFHVLNGGNYTQIESLCVSEI